MKTKNQSKLKNILIISPLFKPEMVRINDFVDYLIEKRYNVTVLCPIPNYPRGQYFESFGIFKKRYEEKNRLKIIRVLVYPRKNGSSINLFLNYLSFIFFSIVPALKLSFKKFDIIFVNQLSPISVAIPGIIIKKIKNIPMVMWVQDLWPESVKEAGNLNSDLIPNLLLPFVKIIYSNCNLILTTSKGFISSIKDKAKDKEIKFLPQWGEEIFSSKNILDKKNNLIDDINGFKIIFAGNIGVSQDFETIIKAIDLVKNTSIHLIVLGEGRAKKAIVKKVKEMNLESKISFLGSFPIEDMPYFFNKSDALLISLKKSEIFSKTIPGKTQAYLATGKPILSNADGEIKDIINLSKCGYASYSGDYKNLARNMIKISKLSRGELEIMGNNSKQYYNNNFQRERILKELENTLIKLKQN